MTAPANLQTVPEVISLRAISNGALKGEALPSRLKLLGWGRNDTVIGPVVVDDISAQVFSANQKALGFERVALDFEHNTVPGSPEYERTQEPRDVAAYGAPRIVAGEGLFLENLEWTKTGQKKARNFEDLSPAVKPDDAGRVIFMHSAGLTRNGAVYGLTFFSAHKTMTTPATPAASAATFITLSALAAALGLPATAAEADVAAKIKKLSALEALEPLFKDGKIVALAPMEERLKKIEDANTAGVATLSAKIDGQVVTFSAEDVVRTVNRLDSLEKLMKDGATAREDVERNELLTRFSAEGKVPLGLDRKPLSADGLKTLSVDVLKMLLANTPATVPLNARSRLAGEQPARDPSLKGVNRLVAAFAEQAAN